MKREEQDEMDVLLEHALANYSARIPRPGLEGRVLSYVQAAQAARKLHFRQCALALAGAACVILALALWRQPVRPPSLPPAPTPPRVQVRTPRMAPPRPVYRAAARTRMQTKQPVFPTPAPITREERALIALIRIAPDQARDVLSAPLRMTDFTQ